MWFDVMISYRDVGGFLCGFSILSLVLYFVTSSDSGSLVIDCLASNGHPEPPRLQRLLWALLEGITASALLVAGGREALSALQAMSIATGFIYTILICIACVALWKALKEESGYSNVTENNFKVGILDPLFTDPLQKVTQQPRCSNIMKLFVKFLVNLVLTPLTVATAVSSTRDTRDHGSRPSFWSYLINLSIFFL